MEEKDSIDIINVEDFKGSKDQNFSHQILVMKIISKCMDAGANEMRSGYYNEKSDKFGNVLKVYIPDSRKQFIETVKTAMNIIERDYDKHAIEKIKSEEEKLDEEYKKLVDLEKKEWDTIPLRLKQTRWINNIYYQFGTLNLKLSYSQEYLEFEVKCYRKVLSELLQLIKRLYDYQSEDYEA